MKTFTDLQIQVMRLSLGLSGLPCNDQAAETVLLVHSEMERMGKEFSLREAAAIEWHIFKKYNPNKITVGKVKPVKKAKRK